MTAGANSSNDKACTPQPIANLEWIDDRWHLDGRGIHAGEVLEIRISQRNNKWMIVRIESTDSGRRLFAMIDVDGPELKAELKSGNTLRWPKGRK